MRGFSSRMQAEVAASTRASTGQLNAMTTSTTRAAGAATAAQATMFSRLKGQIKSLAAFALPALTAIAGYEFVKGSIEAANAEIKVTKSIQQTLITTKDASNATMEGIDKLATSMSKQAGVAKTTILSGESVILMFHNVRNEVGKGNDIFNQASKAALDVAAKMGTAVPSAAKVLARSLEDPLKGM